MAKGPQGGGDLGALERVSADCMFVAHIQKRTVLYLLVERVKGWLLGVGRDRDLHILFANRLKQTSFPPAMWMASGTFRSSKIVSYAALRMSKSRVCFFGRVIQKSRVHEEVC